MSWLKDYINAMFTSNVPLAALKFISTILIVLTIAYAIKLFFKKLIDRLEKTHNFWDDIIIKALIGPAITITIIIGLSIAIDVLDILDVTEEKNIVELLKNFGTIVCITWFCISLMSLSESRYIRRKKIKREPVDYNTLDLVTKLVRAGLIITSTIIAMDVFGVQIKGILTFAGVSGAIIALSARDLLANFFGTILIYSDKPFIIGDRIRFQDKTEGLVERIGWRVTQIRNLERIPMYIPNSNFSSQSIENLTRRSHRRIKEYIGIRYQDASKLTKITKDIENMLIQHQDIDENEPLIARFDKFDDCSLTFYVNTFTTAVDLQDYHEVKENILLEIGKIILKHGAEIAFPTRVLEFTGKSSSRSEGDTEIISSLAKVKNNTSNKKE